MGSDRTRRTRACARWATRHGLYIGTAVDMAALNDPPTRSTARSSPSQFSSVTAENVMKWETPGAHPGHLQLGPGRRADRLRPGRTASWFAATCWSGRTSCPAGSPPASPTAPSATSELRDILRNHITNVVTHFKGKIWQWDVVNEAVSDPWDSPPTIHYKGFWAQHLGAGYIADAFRWARAADPKALLFYNDYNIEAFGSRRRVTTRPSSSTTWSSSCGPTACRSTAWAARATSAPSTATTTPSRSPTRSKPSPTSAWRPPSPRSTCAAR